MKELSRLSSHPKEENKPEEHEPQASNLSSRDLIFIKSPERGTLDPENPRKDKNRRS